MDEEASDNDFEHGQGGIEGWVRLFVVEELAEMLEELRRIEGWRRLIADFDGGLWRVHMSVNGNRY